MRYRCACSVGRRKIAGSIVWSEWLLLRPTTSRHNESLDAHTIDGHRKITVRYGRIPCFDFPQWRCAQFLQTTLSCLKLCLRLVAECRTHRRRWIEYNIGSIQSEHHPVLRMMTSIANIHRNATKVCLKHRVTHIAWWIVRRFIVRSFHTRNMKFPMFSKIFAVIRDDDSRIGQRSIALFLDHWRHDHHVVLLRQLCKLGKHSIKLINEHWTLMGDGDLHEKLCGGTIFGIFAEVDPRFDILCHQSEWCICVKM